MVREVFSPYLALVRVPWAEQMDIDVPERSQLTRRQRNRRLVGSLSRETARTERASNSLVVLSDTEPSFKGSAAPAAVTDAHALGVFMKVLVLGGDGFCGWPTSLHLSDHGHDVTIVDNLSRRKIDVELEVESVTPIRPIHERVRVWKELTANEI